MGEVGLFHQQEGMKYERGSVLFRHTADAYYLFSYTPPIVGASAGTAGPITGAAGSLGYNEVK